MIKPQTAGRLMGLVVVPSVCVLFLSSCAASEAPNPDQSDTTSASASTASSPSISELPTETPTTATSGTRQLPSSTTIQGDPALLDAVLASAPELDGIINPGWEPAHGAPYTAFLYQRGDVGFTIVAAFDESLGLRLAFGEEAEIPEVAEVLPRDGYDILLREGTGDFGRIHAASVADLCGQFTLVAFAIVDDSNILIEDLAVIAESVKCP